MLRKLISDNFGTILTLIGTGIGGLWVYFTAKKKNSAYCPQGKLKNHYFFSWIKKFKRSIIFNFHLDPDIYRRENLENIQEAFRYLMFTKAAIWERLLTELVRLSDCAGSSTGECLFQIEETKQKVYNITEAGLLELTTCHLTDPNLNPMQRQAISVCVGKFHELHQRNVQIFYEQVERVFGSAHLYRSCSKIVINSILDLYITGINSIWSDVHDALTELNGELNPIKFDKKEYRI